MPFKEIAAKEFNDNIFNLVGKDWMLITAGNKDKLNTMTASWGGAGVIWNKNVAFTFIRPQRYTFEFVEENDYFTLSFFNDKYKPALSLCGSKSGRDIDKVSETGLTPMLDEEAPYFEEAKVVIICKKMYADFLDPKCFINVEDEKFYPDKDYHKMFISEIVKILIKE